MREGWVYKKLGAVCDFEGGSQPPKSEWINHPQNGYIRMLQIRDFTKSRNAEIEYVKITKKLRLCKDDDILIGRYGASVGKILTGLAGAYNVAIIKSIPNEELIKKDFIRRYFESPLFQSILFNVCTSRAAQAGFSKDDIKDELIPLPPLSEQQRIVSELDLLSSIIEKKKAQLKEYDQLAQSIFYDMFGDPITNEKGWKLKKMGEVCAQKSKIARASKKFTSNSPIEYIDISSVDNISKTITTTTSYIFSEAPSRAQQIVEYGDILISLVRPNLQNIAIVLYNKNNLVGSSGFCVIRTEQQTIKEYLFYVIRSSHFTDFLMQRVSGANYPAVREEDVKSFTLPIPPLSLQQQFASKIEAIEKQKELIKQSITETETLFNSRMDYYFN